MSRRTIIAVRPTVTGSDFLPQSAPLIEMNGLVQVTEVDGSHCMENDLIRAYRAGTKSLYTKDYIVGNLNANVSTLGKSGLEPYQLMGSLNYPDVSKHINGIWEEKPRPVVITGTTEGNTLTVQSGTGIYKRTVPCTNGATLVYNLIPGRTYNWSESGTNRSGSFKTSGTVRQIKIDIPNFRDVGGYPIYASEASGAQPVGRMRYGKLYRGMGQRRVSAASDAKYENLTYSNSRAAFDEMATRLGIVGELDLRAYSTRTSTSFAKNPGYSGVSNWYRQIEIAGYDSVFSTSSSNMNRDMSTTTKGTPAYHVKLCLEHILSKLSSGGIYFHCKTGADRTGTLAAILMAICGCSITDIVNEWELTSFCRSGYGCSISEYPSSTNNLNIRTWLRWVYKNTSSGTLRERVESLLSSKCGVSASTISALRESLISWNDGEDDSDWTEPVSYAFSQDHLQPNGFSEGSSAFGITKKDSTFHQWEFAEFPVSAGDKVQVGVGNGEKQVTFFAESANGLKDSALALGVNKKLSSGWYSGCFEFHWGSIPLKTRTENGKTYYYAEYTVKHNCVLTTAIKVNNDTTDNQGGAFVTFV